MKNAVNPSELRKVTRRAPKLWRELFSIIVRQRPNSESFTMDDVAYLMRRDKVIDIHRESLRVKLARYSAKGYLRKVGRAEYIITSRGHLFFDVLKNDKEGTMNSS